MGPIVEFIQRHSSKGTSSSRERLEAAHKTPRGDNLSGTPGVQTDAVGTRHPDGSLQQKPGNGKKYKNKDHYFRPKGRLYSNDKTPYQRGGRGDAQGSNSQVRPTSNENAARSDDGYRPRRDEGSHPQTDNR